MALIVRRLTPQERVLIAYLWDVEESGNALPPELLVENMDDGGMGSLSFVSMKPNRSFGGVAGTCSFLDSDGVPVIAQLILDEEGDLHQLDLWKVDFYPLIQIPSASAFSDRE